jgi:serralysin
LIVPISGDDGNNNLPAFDTADEYFGLAGNDTITGGGGDDTMYGGSGIDTISYAYSSGGWRIDLVAAQAISLSGPTVEDIFQFENAWGSQGNDSMLGTDDSNNLEGEDGNDVIRGRGANDMLQGENGNDQLFGDAGADTLIGSVGLDSLTGGTGSDTFVYRSVNESSGSIGDRISGFDGAGPQANGLVGDRIDLSAIDANTATSADTSFLFLGVRTDAQGAAFGERALWVHNDSDSALTFLHGNIDGDTDIELTIRIADGSTTADAYWGGDFIL